VSRVRHHPANTLHYSHHGAAFTALEEGVRTRPYVDSEGWATTGVGHLIQPMHRGVTAWDLAHWAFPSAHAAIDYFRRHDAPIYAQAVRDTLGRAPVTQAQFDMCVDLAINIGTAGFAGSSVARFIRWRNHAGRLLAANAFLLWARPRVLLGRRQRERRRFLIAHW
jgi:GH24 family phage-related lysozyme (muramidase)